MRTSLLALMLTSSIALSANAGDFYGGYRGSPAPAYVVATNWSGFYGGFNGGYGLAADGGLLSPSGGFGGGQIGYNSQGAFGLGRPWVLGVETDIQGSGISDSAVLSLGSVEKSLNWFGTVRGRIGYAFGCTLFYFTGGLAYGQVESKSNVGGVVRDFTNTPAGRDWWGHRIQVRPGLVGQSRVSIHQPRRRQP